VRGEGRYYLEPNLRVNAWGMYAQGRATNSSDFFPTELVDNDAPHMDMQHFAAGAGIEKRLDGSPVSLFARYRYAWTEFKTRFDSGYAVLDREHGSTSDNQFLVGFRLYLNENTLRYNDRMGTTLDIIDPMTEAYRAFGRTWNGSIPQGSDIRLKRDIVELARLDNGLKLYRYRYLWSDQLYVGVMAQEVAEIVPEAVVLGSDGFLRVNYKMLGMRLMTWAEWEAAMTVKLAA
jgi:hypothetical protein